MRYESFVWAVALACLLVYNDEVIILLLCAFDPLANAVRPMGAENDAGDGEGQD